MSFTRKKLAFAQLPDTKGDLYAPSGVIGLAHNIILHNTNTTTEAVEINYHDGSNEYKLWAFDVEADDTVVLDFRGEGLVVPDGAKLTGNTTTAAKVTFLATGSEEA